MKRAVLASWICVTALGCSKNETGEIRNAPAACSDYLSCLSQNDSELLDDEVAKYGASGSCLDNGDTESCAQACEAQMVTYAGSSLCGGDPTAPVAGVFGGLCLAPDGWCEFGVCNREENYCYDDEDPCRGFRCGGEDRGACVPMQGQPSCTCNAGFENETLALYCCPTDGSDRRCG